MKAEIGALENNQDDFASVEKAEAFLILTDDNECSQLILTNLQKYPFFGILELKLLVVLLK